MHDVLDPDRLDPGTRLGRYRVDAVLGRGQMGAVYRATRDDGVPLALKVLKAELTEDTAYRRRFEREGEIAASLEHPNLVPVLDRGEVAGVTFLASPFLPGGDLAERLRSGPLDPARLARLVAEVGAALDALHREGLVHRDVKPANVLLDEEGRALLADFGLARGEAHTILTAAGRVVGTADYLAPEVIRGERASPPADIYSLGCLAYECALGHPPFAGRRTLGDVCVAHLRETPADPAALRRELPRPLAGALVTALAKDPARRPRTGAAYGRLLLAGARGA